MLTKTGAASIVVETYTLEIARKHLKWQLFQLQHAKKTVRTWTAPYKSPFSPAAGKNITYSSVLVQCATNPRWGRA